MADCTLAARSAQGAAGRPPGGPAARQGGGPGLRKAPRHPRPAAAALGGPGPKKPRSGGAARTSSRPRAGTPGPHSARVRGHNPTRRGHRQQSRAAAGGHRTGGQGTGRAHGGRTGEAAATRPGPAQGNAARRATAPARTGGPLLRPTRSRRGDSISGPLRRAATTAVWTSTRPRAAARGSEGQSPRIPRRAYGLHAEPSRSRAATCGPRPGHPNRVWGGASPSSSQREQPRICAAAAWLCAVKKPGSIGSTSTGPHAQRGARRPT